MNNKMKNLIQCLLDTLICLLTNNTLKYLHNIVLLLLKTYPNYETFKINF